MNYICTHLLGLIMKLGIYCLQFSNRVSPTIHIVDDCVNDLQLLCVLSAAPTIAEASTVHEVPCGLFPLHLLMSMPGPFAKASSAVCLIAIVKNRKL